ncbi:MAG: hypothetical protein HY033_12635 [Ignavibacteriae bacterium]|nr:hypothetical protein [Ignavibacteria bacterium]MBI3365740.1 hypothetical protein [Ignavibacteriota bacterium]
MNAMYDVVCSIVIGGIVLVMLVGFNGNIAESAGSQTIKVIAQTNLTTVVSILDFDLRKLGYRITSADYAVALADSNKVRFIGDFGNKGKIDTIIYYFDPTTRSGHSNTKTRILYRTFIPQAGTSSRMMINTGITKLQFAYYDKAGQPLALPVGNTSLIQSLKVSINEESTVPYKETTMKYLKFNPGVYWEQLYKPKNLR